MKTITYIFAAIILFSSCVSTKPRTFQVIGFEQVNGQKIAIVKPVSPSCAPYEYKLGEVICSMPVKLKQ